MDFTRRIELDIPYDDAISRVKDALKDQGFGVLTEIDVRQTLKDKLGIDVEPQIILGAATPTLRRRIKLGTFAALDQRIALRFAMPPMTPPETSGYIAHHLNLAGPGRHALLRRRHRPHPPGLTRPAPGGQQPRTTSTRRRVRRKESHRR